MRVWHKISDFFENGDLTPFAVLVSIAHYGPVLVAHDNSIVAWMVGIIIDMLHFRSVRFAVKRPSWIHTAVAFLTTLMATAYHWRFYDGDWLLALPIPIGIAIMAYHAAERDNEESELSRLRREIDSVVSRSDRMATRLDTITAERDKLLSEHDAILSDYGSAVVERDVARQEVDKLIIQIDEVSVERDKLLSERNKLSPIHVAYIEEIATGVLPNGEFSEKYGIGKSTLKRINSIFR